MKREELLEKGYTEEQASELLDMFHKNNANITKENADLHSLLDSANDKIAGLTKVEAELNALKASQLSEEDKQKLAKAETEKNLRESRIILNTAKAREILAPLGGIDENVLKSIVTDSEDSTVANATNLLNQINSIKEATVNATKESLTTVDVKPTPSNNLDTNVGMTWEKFEAMTDDEQSAFAEEHPDEFANL